MRRILTGSLRHLAPPTLLRLLSATAPVGVLELVSDAGSLRLEVVDGRVSMPGPEELRHAGRVLACTEGAFRFEPCELRPFEGESLSLAAFADAANASERAISSSLAADIDVERLLAGEIVDLAQLARPANIHVLPDAPLANPLDELLSDLEATAPSELLLTQVGVVAQDPRLWRGTLESGWRRRGWQLQLWRKADEVDLEGLDALVLHQEHPLERADHQAQWLDLVARVAHRESVVPAFWVGRLGDAEWMHRLIEAGIGFLMPLPHARTTEALERFATALTLAVDRRLRLRQKILEPSYPSAVCELVDTLLHGADSDTAVGSMLQLASDDFRRGAVLMVEETAIRSRAGFGYPLNREATALPRGVGLLEKAIRGGEVILGIDPSAAGAVQLARVLGVDRLVPQTAVIPFGTGASVSGLLVLDREGESLPDLRDIVLLACCLGGIVTRSCAGSCGTGVPLNGSICAS